MRPYIFAIPLPAHSQGPAMTPTLSQGVAASDSPMLELRGVTKTFPGVVANDNIDLVVQRGHVHAVLGENGSGKSTLMKVIYGYHAPDSGMVLVDGLPVRLGLPAAGRRLGIGMVFQDFSLIPALSVAENVALFLPSQGRLLRRRQLVRRIEQFADEYGLKIDAHRRVDDLTLGERQRVELIKLLLAEARLLIFDEPTSVLAPHEVEVLFQAFAALKEKGYSILFITHKVKEALAAADHITVLRRGRVEVSAHRSVFDADALVSAMVGPVAAQEAIRNARASQPGEVALEFSGVTTGSPGVGGGWNGSLESVSFSVRRGEILGVAGVAGNGQRALGEALLGLEQVRRGTVSLSGRALPLGSASEVLRRGVSLVPEDPLADAMVPEMQVDENLLLAALSRNRRQAFWLNRKNIEVNAKEIRDRFPMPLAGPAAKVKQLSGGNIQRVMLAGELGQGASALLAYYPTRGLDVVSAEATRGLLIQQRDAGAATILVSEDLDELFALSDRLLVMYRGRVAGIFPSRQVSAHEIGLLMTGHAASGVAP